MTPNCLSNFNHNSSSTGGKVFRIAGYVFVGLLFAAAFAIVFAILVKFIWNSMMPAVFDFKEITFWQAFGIIILAKLLFGSFGSRHHDRWKKEGLYTPHWRRSQGVSDADVPPSRHHRDWKVYTQYWQEEGKAAFKDYMDKIEKEQKGE